MARPKPKPLAESIADALRATRRTNWFHQLRPETLAEIETIKARWIAGEYVDGDGKRATPNAMALAIATNLNERGLSTVGRQGVLAWLKQSNP